MLLSENKLCIYKHTNKINGKVYIGQTCKEPEKRWNNGKGYKGTDFAEDIQKFGWDNFDHEILYSNIPTKQEANTLEIKTIAKYNSANPERGYNKTPGGDSGTRTISKERARLNLEDIKEIYEPNFTLVNDRLKNLHYKHL